MAAFSHDLSRSRYALILALAMCLEGCTGIPVSRETAYHIIATGWRPDGKPMALALKARLGKDAYLVGPHVPGIYWRRLYTGVGVLTQEGVSEADVSLPKGDTWWASAIARPDGSGFLTFIRVPNAELTDGTWRCVFVKIDGSSAECIWPVTAAPPPYTSYLAPDGYTIRVRRQIDPAQFWFESWDVRTGGLTRIERELFTLELRFPRDPDPSPAPCDMSWARLSPKQDRYVVACTITSGQQRQSGLWMFGDDLEPKLLLRFTPEYQGPPSPPDTLVNTALWDPQEAYGLAWSPDERFVYFCGGQGAGVIVSTEGTLTRTDLPCLTLATWSPDGDRIAGVLGLELSVLAVSATAPGP